MKEELDEEEKELLKEIREQARMKEEQPASALTKFEYASIQAMQGMLSDPNCEMKAEEIADQAVFCARKLFFSLADFGHNPA